MANLADLLETAVPRAPKATGKKMTNQQRLKIVAPKLLRLLYQADGEIVTYEDIVNSCGFKGPHELNSTRNALGTGAASSGLGLHKNPDGVLVVRENLLLVMQRLGSDVMSVLEDLGVDEQAFVNWVTGQPSATADDFGSEVSESPTAVSSAG